MTGLLSLPSARNTVCSPAFAVAAARGKRNAEMRGFSMRSIRREPKYSAGAAPLGPGRPRPGAWAGIWDQDRNKGVVIEESWDSGGVAAGAGLVPTAELGGLSGGSGPWRYSRGTQAVHVVGDIMTATDN